MIFDHYGLLGTEKTPVNWQRLLGGVVIFIGVLLTLQRWIYLDQAHDEYE